MRWFHYVTTSFTMKLIYSTALIGVLAVVILLGMAAAMTKTVITITGAALYILGLTTKHHLK